MTGSNIPTAEEVGPNPVLTLNRDLINKSGERQAAELLRRSACGQCQRRSNFEQCDRIHSWCCFDFAAWLYP